MKTRFSFWLIVLLSLTLIASAACRGRQPETTEPAPAPPASEVTPDKPPAASNLTAPARLRVTSTTATTARIAWDDKSTGEQGFQIEVEGGDRIKTGPNETQWELTGFKCNRGYNLRVRAVNADGTSDWSNQVTAQTLACAGDQGTSGPAAPDGLILGTQTFNLTTFTLGAHDNAENEDGFYLYVDGKQRAIVPPNKGSGQMTIWLSTLLPKAFECGKTYTFELSAFNDKGESAHSDPYSWKIKCQ